MKNILVIGSSGFVGRRLTLQLLRDEYNIRCLARNPEKIKDLAAAGCEVVKGDMLDAASVETAVKSMNTVYISVHTLSAQKADNGFMDIELKGLQNIVAACKKNNVKRVVYITFLGVAQNACNEWSRGRFKTEQYLLNSGLDVTILRPGMIVGKGGQGFDMILNNAKKRFAIVIGDGKQKFRCIAVDDLVYYLIGVMNEPNTFGHVFDVGSGDVLSANEMINAVADVIGTKHPTKIHIPSGLMIAMSTLIERIAKLPKGAMKGILEALKSDMIGNPTPIKTILSKKLLTLSEATKSATAEN